MSARHHTVEGRSVPPPTRHEPPCWSPRPWLVCAELEWISTLCPVTLLSPLFNRLMVLLDFLRTQSCQLWVMTLLVHPSWFLCHLCLFLTVLPWCGSQHGEGRLNPALGAVSDISLSRMMFLRFFIDFLKKHIKGAPGWLSRRSGQLLISGSWVWAPRWV